MSAYLIWTDYSFARQIVINTKCRTALRTSKRSRHLLIRKRKQTGKQQETITKFVIASFLRSNHLAGTIPQFFITLFCFWNTFDFPDTLELWCFLYHQGRGPANNLRSRFHVKPYRLKIIETRYLSKLTESSKSPP